MFLVYTAIGDNLVFALQPIGWRVSQSQMNKANHYDYI